MAREMIPECGHAARKEFRATQEKPYHFVDSGLPNVYLAGVRYFECECGHKAVEIPALKQLMSLIARHVVLKNESLTGDEIRFLRKRLSQKAADFSTKVKLQPETLSRVENSKQSIGSKTDMYIRIYYSLASKDPVLLDAIKEAVDKVFSQKRKAPKKPAKTLVKMEHDEWALSDAA